MKFEYYDQYINKNTRQRYDVTPIFEHPKVFAHLINDLGKPFKNFDLIVGIDALGFILGGALALNLKKGFVPIRKGGKLPGKNIMQISFIDYTGKKKTFEMNKGVIKNGDKIVIVDEWIETGSQVKAAIKLIEKQGGTVIGIAALAAEKTPKTMILFKKYNCKPIKVLE